MQLGHEARHPTPFCAVSASMFSPFQAPTSRSSAERGDSGHASDRPTLLLVEDEEVLRRLLSTYLGRLGFEVFTADSAEEGLRIALDTPASVHLLITDIMLPGMTGLELAMQLRERFPTLPTVLITAYPPEILERNGFTLGDFPLLNKPFSTDDLRQTISILLGFVIPAPA